MARRTPCRAAALALTALIAAAVTPAPLAPAQSGPGLYEPFPEAAVKERAKRYVERLSERTADTRRSPSDAELTAGVFVKPDPRAPALRPDGAPSGDATRRAGGDAAGGLPLLVQIALLIAALALPAGALTNRARVGAA